ncbi:MAG: hypothetical protein M5U28_36115 [Sandaracinaceae bacterium]|nr:hypothetical protein [Sandaracinaceae bacterium]
MTTALHREAINACPPGDGDSTAIPSAGSTSAIDLSAHLGRFVTFKSDTSAHVRFGASDVGAATAGDIYLTADADATWRIVTGRTHLRALDGGSAGGRIFYAVTSEPV